MEDFAALLQKIAQKLVLGGKLIFPRTSHCHLLPRGERWEKDTQKQQITYRLNYYRDEGKRERNWFKQPFLTYHRTLATIINQLIENGFQIQHIAEPMLEDQRTMARRI